MGKIFEYIEIKGGLYNVVGEGEWCFILPFICIIYILSLGFITGIVACYFDIALYRNYYVSIICMYVYTLSAP